ncbi:MULTISPECIES: hypothetical protein [unclassified Leisingera]|uniref:hypothetical protein n=1 Tax=unclassified Leisingera TaxID=2614906 RepID=UPI0002F18B60|nr:MULTISPECIES: hypothetical protein [unclassified Leisingera]KIC26563.1 hypothetical protein RA23_02165 [Leisingera sp. ANG-S3]KIC53791.1 hypothetical protein RA22_08750 [Leisingera sp. ANG-S]KID10279.1 hypothetical protein GC1_00870 [Leisingera sp. ANG1]
MHKPLALTLACALVLSACGWRDSRLNPSNWFGSSEPAEVEVAENVNPLLPQDSNARGIFAKKPPEDKSVLISRIDSLEIERTSTGAIIHATGVAARQGAFDVELRRVDGTEEGVLTYDFRIVYPEQPTITGSEFSRTLHAARTLSNQDLQEIRLVRVNGETNARESRRR